MAGNKKKTKSAKQSPHQSAVMAGQRFKQLFAQGNFEAALNTVLLFCQRMPHHADAWADAATTCIMLGRWSAAIQYAQRALKYQPQQMVALDALAHAHGALGQFESAGTVGLQALMLRDAQFGQSAPLIAHASPSTWPSHGRKVIAFSLFGAQAKYCEGAILNCLAQPTVYPHWQCLFYVDDSVPPTVIARLKHAGGQIIQVDARLQAWPGPMWRFAAYDMDDVDVVIFRDCDAIIQSREAEAVTAWMDSGQAFHMMRDYGSHTELMLAGLWGVRKGALPAMHALIEAFLRKPVVSQHFADQFFLREYVWPYAKTQLLQHDSLFGFLNAVPFPNHTHQADYHVGCNESSTFFKAAVSAEDGKRMTWMLFDTRENPERLICSYDAVVKQNSVQASLPRPYVRLLNSGAYVVRLQTPSS